MWCRNVKELYDRLDGGTRAAASVAGLVVDAAKQPAAGATAEQLQALFRQHDSVSHELEAGLTHAVLGRPSEVGRCAAMPHQHVTRALLSSRCCPGSRTWTLHWPRCAATARGCSGTQRSCATGSTIDDQLCDLGIAAVLKHPCSWAGTHEQHACHTKHGTAVVQRAT